MTYGSVQHTARWLLVAGDKRPWHVEEMTDNLTYIAHYVDPNGVEMALDEIRATDEQAAMTELGRIVRGREELLHRDGIVALMGPNGPVSGSVSKVSEHLAGA